MKMAASKAAVDMVKEGMIVGLGTGSTAYYFIRELIRRCKEGLKISALPSSEETARQAIEGGIPLLKDDKIKEIDITVDGVDYVNARKELIKGGGGALLREKIVAMASKEMIVIVDETKMVEDFINFLLPVEVTPFGWMMTLEKLQQLHYKGKRRMLTEGKPFVTDNGNFIIDIHFETCLKPEKEHYQILAIAGVVETGFFINLASIVIIGEKNGHVKILQ